MEPFRFVQLDYPRAVFKGAETKVVADAAAQRAAQRDGWFLTEADAKAAEKAAAEKAAKTESTPAQ